MARTEVISKIEVLPCGEVLVALRSRGCPDYQHVSREAAGVYWNSELGGFASRDRRTRSCAEWVRHIVSVCHHIGIALELGENVAWVNVDDAGRTTILERGRIGGAPT